MRALKALLFGSGSLVLFVIGAILFGYLALNFFRIDIPTAHMAILIKKTGDNLTNDQEVAPTAEFKGVQREYLLEGTHWRNPYNWDWKIIPQEEVSQGKMGVLVSLTGDNLGYGEFLARTDPKVELLQGGVLTKGIVPGYLNAGRYPINPYLFKMELHDPIVVPAGFRGVVTNLSGPMPEEANTLLVPPDFRGVQKETLGTETYYFNPYEKRVNLVDCRSQRFNLAEKKDMGFPSKDGFWVSLDGIVEFRIMPEHAAEVYVTYNEQDNGEKIDEEIIRKVIMPIARSFCRVEGSKNSGRDFISGETRIGFQKKFEEAMRTECQPLGIEIVVALITNISPPQQIAEPVRKRELAKQEEKQYQQQILQQTSEQNLAIEKELVKRKRELIQAEQEVVKLTTQAMREQEVAVTKANENLEVAKLKLEAAADEAEAIIARGTAEADVVGFNNEADAAGWKRAVEAFSGDGDAYARYVLNQKIAPSYQKIMANTQDSPIMKIFESFATPSSIPKPEPSSTPAPMATTPAP
ncbi:SPFH domain-containing protein [Rubinisphaera italica]|uniref:SPFH domain / Band 7 family protein n=1 Tax=Rubinisphaera italica TaxID=2527969 RepID=A0A5C5XJB0_9PLAN|nr:SPFH domain-containing protein [Rubinisphaera italica]TWT61862.1 SPFH domain / Band 7 family protein [Rubinisphaera italica]